jgi:hypothetical protein
MKILTATCILLAFCIFASCDEDPVELKKKAPPNYSGTFLMADTLQPGGTCMLPVPPGASEDVVVWNDSIQFAGLLGSWDAATLRGQGTHGPVYIQVDPGCTAFYNITFDITYVDVDHFYGTWHVVYNYPGGCTPSYTCSYTYNIGGTRP